MLDSHDFKSGAVAIAALLRPGLDSADGGCRQTAVASQQIMQQHNAFSAIHAVRFPVGDKRADAGIVQGRRVAGNECLGAGALLREERDRGGTRTR